MTKIDFGKLEKLIMELPPKKRDELIDNIQSVVLAYIMIDVIIIMRKHIESLRKGEK